MSAGIYRVACPGCKKVLKIELSDIPDADFAIDCPRCKTKVQVRAGVVKAAAARPASAGAKPSEAVGVWSPLEPSVPSSTARSAAVPDEAPARASSKPGVPRDPVRPPSRPGVSPTLPPDEAPSGFGTNDMTKAILQMNAARASANPPESAPPSNERSDPGLDLDSSPREAPRAPAATGPRVVPTNAPRTTPRPPPAAPMKIPAWAVPVGAGAATLVLLVAATFLLFHHGSGSGGGGGSHSTPSTVESDASVKSDLADLKKKYPGGDAAALFAQGLAALEGDTSAEHHDASDLLRQAAGAGETRALAAAAFAASLLPRSEREGLTVTQANQWADFVQRTRPDAAIGALSRAALLASLGRDADALTTAEAAKSAHPDDAMAWFVSGWVRARTDPAKGAEEIRHAVTLKPDFRLALTELAAAELAADHLRAAQLALDARAAAGPLSGRAEKLEGDLAMRIGDDPTARKHYEAAVTDEPKDADARLALAWQLVRMGDGAGAAAAASHVVDVDRKADDATEEQAAEAHVALAAALRRLGKGNAAAAAARAAIDEPQTRGVAQYQLGLALLSAGHAEEAIEPLKDAQQKSPGRTAIPAALGMAQWKAGRTEDSIASFNAALAADPDLAVAHVGLALDYADAELSTKVVDELGRLVDETHPLSLWQRRPDPRFPEPSIDVAAFTSRLKKLEDADPNRDPHYKLWRGAVECLGGDMKNGLAHMNIPGLEPSAAAFVAGWQLAAGRAADAARLSARAETARELATRGWAMRTAKIRGDEAVFSAALAANANDPWAALGRAQSLIARGKKHDAKDMLDRAAARLAHEPLYARTAMALEDAPK